MIVTLFSENKMHKITLPQSVNGNYWIRDNTEKKESKLLNIDGRMGKWCIVSNSSVQIINLKSIKTVNGNIKTVNGVEEIEQQVYLNEYDMYGIYIVSKKEFYILYCQPTFENNLKHLNITHTQEICIGSGPQNHICYKNRLVSETHAKIILNDGRLILENHDEAFGTFVNGNQIGKETRMLFNGDVVFLMGLKIIIMGNSIYINNPKNSVKIIKENLPIYKEKNYIPIEEYNEEDDEDTVELYSEKDYYSRAPRITNLIEEEEVKIDAPPQIQNKEETPLLLTIGSSVSMGAMMLVSMLTTIDSKMTGQSTTKQTVFTLITTCVMLLGMLLIPILTIRYEKNKKLKYEKKRQTRYKEYLSNKVSEISKIKNKQRSILFKNYVSAEECTKIILNRDARLWERKIEDYDFLSIRLGIGDMPLKIKVDYPAQQFAMEDDNLLETLHDIGKNSETLNGAPIITSLAEKNVTAFVKQDEENFEKFIQNIIVQLVTFQSYEDLKIIFLLDKDKQKKWEYVKMIPHLWESSHEMRFFADEYDDMKEISHYLEEAFRNRIQSEGDNYKAFSPYYLIITDNYKKIESLGIIKQILKSKINFGFSLLCITEDLTQLPNECKTFINIDNKKGMIFENEISAGNHREITLEVSNTFFFGRIWQTIANIPIRSTSSGRAALPTSYTFLEMFDVGLIEQLNILDRWKTNDSTLSLKAQIGIDENKMPIVLDIHEKFHGPHGLVAGSTGSGKSEFLITYILSLAINYHPDDLNFVLIDYKGGGLAGAFEKNDIKLPHLVGTITNIDTNGLQRSLASIHSEVMRRQVMFNEARNKTDEGTIDIYKYQKLYHDGIVDKPISHLLIICDEFAELKQQQPDFMDELISISRIGRSLGVHLILATQKPAGIVNDQIRSNSKFGICLKVQDAGDSMDVIKKPDAAKIKNAGQFYMQVGNDDYFILGQSAWSGAPYFPSATTKKIVDTSVQFISNIGAPIKTIDDSKKQVVKNGGEQLTNTVKYICNIAKENNIKTDSLWLEDVPETIYLNDVIKKYNIKPQKNQITAIIGEYDDPYNQKQAPVELDLSKGGNVAVYGNAESGKETLLSTLVYNLMTTYTTEQVQMYLLDFGSEALKIYQKSPHVGDIIFMGEDEKLGRFFDMLQEEIAERKTLLSDYNGDYQLYLEKADKPMPMIVVMINNYEGFNELYEAVYDDLILTLTREGLKYGINFVVSASAFNDIRYRLSQNFKKRVALQVNKEDDYFNMFDKVGKKRPRHVFGRGLMSIEDNVYEFETAKICEGDDYNNVIEQTIEQLKAKNKMVAKTIPTLPDKVSIEDVKSKLKNLSAVPIGIREKNLKLFPYNFKGNFMNIILAKKIKDAIEFCFNVLELMKQLEDTDIIILNADKTLQGKSNNFVDDYNIMLKEMRYVNKNNRHVVCVIIGIDKFLDSIDETEFKQTLETAQSRGNYSFILIEGATKLKDHAFDKWYKEFISGDSGIWVGNGIDGQFSINITANRRGLVDNCGRDFGYVIKEGNYAMIKLLGMKSVGDDDE